MPHGKKCPLGDSYAITKTSIMNTERTTNHNVATTKRHYGKTLGSFLVVLLLMPLGHALMILMEHFLSPETLHYSAFLMGFAGLVITICGALQKGDTRQTIWGISGAMLFWTGWVEFLLAYYAQRYGTHCDLVGSGIVQTTSHYIDGVAASHDFLVNGQPLEGFSRAEIKELRGSRPEYLIMPATFGMWMMFMVLYLFCSRTGCNFMQWVQKHCGIEGNIELRPMAHHASIVVFMEWNIMMWGLYLLLMFCYDPCVPWQFPPCHLRHRCCGAHSLHAHAAQTAAHRRMGQEHTFRPCDGDNLLDLCGDSRTQRILQGNTGRSYGAYHGDVHNTCCVLRHYSLLYSERAERQS